MEIFHSRQSIDFEISRSYVGSVYLLLNDLIVIVYI